MVVHLVHLVTVIRNAFLEEETFELNTECCRIWIGRFRDTGENSQILIT